MSLILAVCSALLVREGCYSMATFGALLTLYLTFNEAADRIIEAINQHNPR